MKISFQKVIKCENPTINIKAGELLTINHIDPSGNTHTFCIGAEQGILLIAHENTEAAIAVDTNGNIQYSPPIK